MSILVIQKSWPGSMLTDKKKPQITTAKNGHVYLIRASRGYYKIGISTDVDRRMKTLSKKYPTKGLTLIHTISSNDYSMAERYFHNLFREAQIIGEWFMLSQHEVDLFCSYSTFDYETSSLGGSL